MAEYHQRIRSIRDTYSKYAIAANAAGLSLFASNIIRLNGEQPFSAQLAIVTFSLGIIFGGMHWVTKVDEEMFDEVNDLDHSIETYKRYIDEQKSELRKNSQALVDSGISGEEAEYIRDLKTKIQQTEDRNEESRRRLQAIKARRRVFTPRLIRGFSAFSISVAYGCFTNGLFHAVIALVG